MKAANIIFDDENCYFAAGLWDSIMQYTRTNNQALCFLTSCGAAQPDVAIASARRRAQRWCRTGFNEAITPVITIKERCFAAAKAKDAAHRQADHRDYGEKGFLSFPRCGGAFSYISRCACCCTLSMMLSIITCTRCGNTPRRR